MKNSFSVFPSHLPLLLLLLLLSMSNGYRTPVPKDFCHPNPCRNGGTCSVVVGLFKNRASCSCVGGNSNKDDVCNPSAPSIAKNPCEPNPCGPEGECFPELDHAHTAHNFKCVCETDRTGDRCEIETGRPKNDFHPFAL